MVPDRAGYIRTSDSKLIRNPEDSTDRVSSVREAVGRETIAEVRAFLAEHRIVKSYARDDEAALRPDLSRRDPLQGP